MTGQDQAAPSGKIGQGKADARLRTERVWISASFNNTSIYKRFRVMLHDQPGVENAPEQTERLVDMARRYNSGEGLREDEIPTRFCGWNPDTRIRNLTDFFRSNGYFIVSERCADVFRRFDLGTGGLYPLSCIRETARRGSRDRISC